MVRQHRILGLIIDDRLNWNVHLKDVKARAQKKLGLLKTPAHKKWGGDRKTLLRIHQMIVLSILRLEESIYGTSHKISIRTDTQQGRETSIRSFCDLQNGKCTLRSRLPNALGNDRTEHDNCSNTSTNE
jgi:hypothetical protein